jgi:uncharacterized protein (DUF362 family)
MPLPSPPVSVVHAPPERLGVALSEALDAVGWRRVLDEHEHVLVKPNLGYDLPSQGACTSPQVLAATVELLVEHGHRVTIIEGDQVLVRVERAAELAGVPALCRHPRVSWCNLSRAPTVTRSLPGARVFGRVELPAILGTAPLISLPVMKTHAKCAMTGAIKNQWGLLPTDRHRYHSVLDEALADLYALAPPDLVLMDATVCMEGNGPKSGRPRRLDTVMASRDAFALDWTAAGIMGIDPSTVGYLATIRDELGLDTVEVDLHGDLPRVRPFLAAQHNLVSLVEATLRDSPVAPLVFHGPLFALACRSARLWYQAGSWLEGRRDR